MTNDERAQLEVLRAEVNGKLDLLIERTTNLLDRDEDHERRLRSLEKWRYAIPASILLTVAAIVGSKL